MCRTRSCRTGGRAAVSAVDPRCLLVPALLALAACAGGPAPERASAPPEAGSGGRRCEDIGLDVGILPRGRWNAITDVEGVRVGHCTLVRGEDVRTGVTVLVPHPGDLYRSRVPAAVSVGNGFGKAVGFTQVRELGELETPIALTNTLSTFRVADALVTWMLQRPGNGDLRSVNPVVGETNDGYLNDIRGRHVRAQHVLAALEQTASGPVPEGCVGAGTGTRCMGFKGGVGTASRVLPGALGGWTLGALVQTNFGGVLTINGAPVGRELGSFTFGDVLQAGRSGSCMIVLATDAPLSPRNLERLAQRSFLALGRVGAFSANGSGDYAIAFSTHPGARRQARPRNAVLKTVVLANTAMSPLFLAAVEAAEEAIYNALLAATTTQGRKGREVQALPLPRTLQLLRTYGALHQHERL